MKANHLYVLVRHCSALRRVEALVVLGVQIHAPAQQVDLVGRCRLACLEVSRLLSCSTSKDRLPFLWRISPRKLLTPQVRTCLCGGASIPDVDAPFESCLPGVAVDVDMNATQELDDQEPNAPTDDDHSGPDWG